MTGLARAQGRRFAVQRTQHDALLLCWHARTTSHPSTNLTHRRCLAASARTDHLCGRNSFHHRDFRRAFEAAGFVTVACGEGE